MSRDAGKGSSLTAVGLGLLAMLGWFRSTAPSAVAPAVPAAGASAAASSPASSAAAVTPPSASGQPPGEPAPWRQTLRPYEEFFGLPGDPGLDRASAIARVRQMLPERSAGADTEWLPWQLQFMVALVPDPLDSQLPAAFDQAIDAIGQGLAYSNSGRSAYLQDRSWIPWNDDAAVKDRAYRVSPGLLLFRRFRPGQDGRQERQLMGVFLVGETPKTGIHQVAFLTALQLIRELSAQDAPLPVKVLGPTYSGSAVSLRTALLNWLGRPQAAPAAAAASRFLIVSGSARAPCLEDLLLLGTPPAVTFYRAVVPLDVLLPTALENLHDGMGWDLRKLVLITELDTAFGQSVRAGSTAANGKQPQPARSVALQAGCQPSPIPARRVLHFPSHILAIRSARAAAGLDKAPPDPNQIGSQPTPVDLPLNLAPGPAGADLVPDFSALTAPATEIAIAGLISAMARDDVRYVGILATDVSDTLFLADRIRSQARNVTLFALEGDQLFLHPQVHSAVNGMTVLSSSPLLISGRLSQEGGGGGRRGQPPWQLASTFGNGIFEAAAELVSDRSLADVAVPDVGPIWISVVGNDAIWPLWGRMSGKDSGQDTSAAGAKDQPEQVLSFASLVRLETGTDGGNKAGDRLAAGTGGATADLDLLLFAIVMCFGAWMLHQAALLPVPPRAADAERGTRSLLAAGVAVLVLAGAVLVALGLPPQWKWNGSYLEPAVWALQQRLSFVGLILVYLVLVLALVSAVAVRRSRRGARPRLRRWGAAVVTLLAGLAVVPLLAWAICGRWMLCDVAFDQRVRAFASGLSPLISLFWLVSALYLWALLELKRRRLTAWQRIDWPLAEVFEPALRGSSRLLGTIRWLLAVTVAASWWRRLALAGIVVASLSVVWHPMQPAAERPEFGRLMLALWTLPVVLSAISCYRFVRVWQTLRKLLVRIASTPLASRLAMLSEALRWKPMQALTWPIPPFDTLILSLVRLKELRRAGTVTLTDAELRDVDRFLGLAFKAEAREKARAEIINRERLEHLIAVVSRQLALRRDQPGVEDFFAIRVAAYLRYVFAQLRGSLMSALGPAVLVLLAVAAYTFEPKGLVSLGFLVLVLAEIVLAVAILVAMNRDTVLSLIAGNSPGEVTWNWHFMSSLLTFGVLPLLALIGTQVPAAGQLLNGWLKPLLHLAGVG
jgi:hypothetical protein